MRRLSDMPTIIQDYAEQVRPPGQRATDGDAAGAAAAAGKVLGRGVVVVDQILPTGDEVENGVELGALLAGKVPGLAVLAAAAHMCDRHTSPRSIHASAMGEKVGSSELP